MGSEAENERYSVEELDRYTRRMLEAVGMNELFSEAMSHRLVDGDLLGHHTHGTWALRTYLDRIAAGHIRCAGEPELLHDSPSTISWDAHRLPGAWMMDQAIGWALTRLDSTPVVTVSIGDCSHIGCLQSYLIPFTDRGLLVSLTATNPGVSSVAAPNGTRPIITTNPMAMGIPSRSTPILIDQCTSVGSNALFENYAARSELLPGRWLVDPQGEPTADPSVLNLDPPGSIQPLGQAEFGYKGFGFGLMSEALALALSGHGRKSRPDRHGQSVFLQVIDPAGFGGGADAFLDEVDWLISAVKDDPGRAGSGVRLPGERALRNRRDQRNHGVAVHSDARDRLRKWSADLGIPFPRGISELSDDIGV